MVWRLLVCVQCGEAVDGEWQSLGVRGGQEGRIGLMHSLVSG